MEFFKVLVIQVLFASLPVLLVPSFETFVRTRALRLLRRSGGDSVGLAFTFASAASLLLCWMLDAGSPRIDGHLSLLPTGMGILYGVPRARFPLIALYALVGYIFSAAGEMPYVWIEALALLLLALGRTRLLDMRRSYRRLLIAAWLIVAYVPHAAFHVREETLGGGTFWGAFPMVSIELMAAFTAALLLLYSRRDVQDRYSMSAQAITMRERMLEEERKLQSFMGTLPGYALALDRAGLISEINDQAYSAIVQRAPSFNRQMLIGRSFSDLMGALGMQADPVFLEALDLTFRENKSAERTLVFGTRKFRLYLSPTHTQGGQVGGAMCSIYEVTEIERMRTELENMNRLSLIGQMAAGVTHEVRNPMAVVRGYLQILQRKTPEEYEHYYKIVLEELDRAGGIIDDFLSLARTSSGEKENRSLRSVLDDLWPLLQADANLRGQLIRFEDGKDGEAMPMHAGEIKQLVLNLARNALEAMDEKGELVIFAEQTEESIVLRVTDNGPGIPEETLQQIRQPFFTTKKTGTGLGLALCSGIAERHGGQLSIQSTVGVGTEVRVEFARARQAEPVGKA